MLIEIAIRDFLRSRQAKGLSTNTIRWYSGILRSFSMYSKKLPKEPSKIEDFLINQNCGDERRHGYYRCLRAFYKFLDRRCNAPNPILKIDPPVRKPKQPGFLLPAQIYKLMACPHPPKIRAALTFLVDTGARLGEMANLTISDLEETPFGFMATIRGKTGARHIPISYESYHAMIVNLPFPYQPHRLGELISRAFKQAGVKGTAHTLRHTFGSLWEGDEFALQRIMGHSHIETTKLYRHLRMEHLMRQHNQYSPLKYVEHQAELML